MKNNFTFVLLCNKDVQKCDFTSDHLANIGFCVPFQPKWLVIVTRHDVAKGWLLSYSFGSITYFQVTGRRSTRTAEGAGSATRGKCCMSLAAMMKMKMRMGINMILIELSHNPHPSALPNAIFKKNNAYHIDFCVGESGPEGPSGAPTAWKKILSKKSQVAIYV